MEIETKGHNSGSMSVYVTNLDASINEHFLFTDNDLEERTTLADQFINTSVELVTASGFTHDVEPWLQLLSTYLDNAMCERLTELVQQWET